MTLSTIEAVKCGSIYFNRVNMSIISIASAYISPIHAPIIFEFVGASCNYASPDVTRKRISDIKMA
jgi:hypothetical protein